MAFGQLTFKSSFAVENNFYVGNLAAGNFDGDSFPDLVYTNSSEKKIEIRYNPGSPGSSSTQSIPVSTRPGSMAFAEYGDFNNDSKTDVMAVSYNRDDQSQQIIILISSGNSFAQQTIDLPMSYYNWFPKVVDFDKDGNTDILMANTQSVYFYKGDGHGNFSSSVVMGTPLNWSVFKCADLDLDGQNDFVFIGTDTLFVSLKKTGASGYTNQKYPFTSPVAPISLAIGDVSGDGYPEIIASLFIIGSPSSQPFLSDYVNDGHGGFGAPTTIGTGAVIGSIGFSNIALFDYDKDGRVDVLTGYDGYGQDFKLLKNMGSNQFTDQSTLSYCVIDANTILFADLDNDGTAEIVELSLFKYLRFFNQVAGVYQFTRKIMLGTTANNGSITDLNGDGNQDIVVTSGLSGALSIFYGAGNNNFNKPVYYTSNNDEIRASTSADFNGDGFQDVAYATANGSIKPALALLLSDPNGALTQPVVIDNLLSSWTLVTGDFNGDGKIDLVTSQGVYLNDGAANFTNKYFYTGVGVVTQMNTGNFNADNYLDLVINDGGANYISLNDGQGNFGTFTKLNSTGYVTSLKSGLFNADDLTDLISLNSNNGVSLFINQGDGNFTEKIVTAPANAYFQGSVDMDDINFDGLKDFVVGVSANGPQPIYGVSIFLQDVNGNFNFSQNVGFSFGIDGGNSVPNFLQIADINSDNKKDIVAFKLNGDPIEIILNDFVFEPTQGPQSLTLTDLTDQSAAFSLQKGNGDARLGVIREIAAKKILPSDGVFYSSNPKFGIGAQIGAANYVVLRADSSAIHVTGLKGGTSYSLTVYEYAVNSSNTTINYLTASSDSIQFTTKKTQTISMPAAADKTVTDAPFLLDASASSGLPVTYTLASGGVLLNGDSVKIVAPGPVKIIVTQIGDDSFATASAKELDFCVNPLTPVITTANLSPGKYTLTSSSNTNNQWLLNDQPISSATQTSFDPIDNGIYSVKVDFSGCSSTSIPTPFLITGLEKIASEFQIFPNPFSQVASLQIPQGDDIQQILIVDVTGRSNPVSFLKLEEKTTINMAEFATGIYFFKVITLNRSYFAKAIKVD